MASIKPVLRQNPNREGHLPLCIRITKDRKTTYIYTNVHLPEVAWDAVNHKVKKSHPNSVRLNNFIQKKLAETNDQCLELESSKATVSAKAVKQKIMPSSGATFFGQAELYLADLKQAGKYNQYTADKPRIKHFRQFLTSDIAFQDITVALLEHFRTVLMTDFKLSERSAVNHLVMVRSVFSHAIKRQVLDAKHYPFGKGKVKIKFPESIKLGLTQEEVQRLEKVELTWQPHHARNLWLISFYFAGMRISDVFRLRWSDFKDNRLHYEMGKNGKVGSLAVPEKALAILDVYRRGPDSNGPYVFPELQGMENEHPFRQQKTIAYKTSALDKCLKTYVAPAIGTDKTLTMHIARHTFGNLAGDRIPIQMLQKLYRHSSIVTTIGYQANFIHREADDALSSVIEF
jgi:integrase